jgi:transcription-repair coupling factor (superfamily II helicase)
VELTDMSEELKDRYGPVPEPLGNLLQIIGLKILLSGMRMKRLECSGNQIILHVTERTPLDMKKILKEVKEDKGRIKLLPDGRIVIRNDSRAEDIVTTTRNMLKRLVAV